MSGKIIITAGGTAGHIYPAQAIIEHIRKNYPDVRMLYIGTISGMENELIPPLGIDFRKIRATGFSASSSIGRKIYIYLKFLFNLAAGIFRCMAIINNFKPDYVLGMGGYICAPVFISAILMRKRIAVHEQNMIPGRLNKFFAKTAKHIFISFEESGAYFKKRIKKDPEKIIFSGNPVREEIKDFLFSKTDFSRWGLEEKRFTITIFGGSLGAERINESAISLYEKFRKNEKIQIVLICGNRFFEDYSKRLSRMQESADYAIFRLFPYVKEMASIYRVSDLVVSRAGATTIAELAITNIPAVLVPYPEAIENHQYFNAEYLVKNKKAVLIADDELSGETLSGIIEALLENNCYQYKQMKAENLILNKLDSAAIITAKLLEERKS